QSASHGLLRALERGATSVQVELLSGSVPPPRDTVDEPQPLLVTHLVIHRPTLPRDTPPGADRRSTRALWRRPAGCRRLTGGFALRLADGAEVLRDTVRRDREGLRRGTTVAPALTVSDYWLIDHGVPESFSIATRRRLPYLRRRSRRRRAAR